MIAISIGEYHSLIHSLAYFISTFIFTGSEPKRKRKNFENEERRNIVNLMRMIAVFVGYLPIDLPGA